MAALLVAAAVCSKPVPTGKSKYPRSYVFLLADPIDRIFLSPAMLDPLADLCRALRLSPNSVTAANALLATGATFLQYHGSFRLAAPLWVIVHLLDNLDGHFARRHQMCSKFGAWFDPFADVYASACFLASLLLTATELDLGRRICSFIVGTVAVLACLMFSEVDEVIRGLTKPTDILLVKAGLVKPQMDERQWLQVAQVLGVCFGVGSVRVGFCMAVAFVHFEMLSVPPCPILLLLLVLAERLWCISALSSAA